MNSDELRNAFDRQASTYDAQWTRLAPINEAMFFLLERVFSSLPHDARILCVGVGTGTELLHFAGVFPGWQLTAVEPSGPMLDVCRKRVNDAGLASRCRLIEGYVEDVPLEEPYHAATCFLVSQFILDTAARSEFFAQIADRLAPGGLLANTDLSADVASPQYHELLAVWQQVMSGSEGSADAVARMRANYEKDVAILHPDEVAKTIEAGGFEAPVRYFQAGLVHGWFAKRAG